MHSDRTVSPAAQSGRLPPRGVRRTGAADRSGRGGEFRPQDHADNARRARARTFRISDGRSARRPFRISDHIAKPIQDDELYAFIADFGERMRAWVRDARERASSGASR